MAEEMKRNHIALILIHIDEAHSDDMWPINLPDKPQSHTCIEDRFKKANDFVEKENPPFLTLVDTWTNPFAEIYRAWPDKYYCCTNDLIIIDKSKYGKHGKENALIKVDCTELITTLY